MRAAGTFAAFALLELTLCAIPGPAVLVTIATTLRRGRAHGAATRGEIVAGNTASFALSAVGAAALSLASYRAFAIVKFVGAAYLAYLGVRGLVARGEPFVELDRAATSPSGSRASR